MQCKLIKYALQNAKCTLKKYKFKTKVIINNNKNTIVII